MVAAAAPRSMVRVTKGATPSDVYRNPVLENVSIAAFQDPSLFVAHTWFPTVPVTDEAFKYYVFDMNSIGRNKMQPRAPGTVAQEGQWNISETSALCLQYGYREKVPEELQLSAGPAADIDIAATRSCAEVSLINGEVRASAYFTTSIWTGGIGINGGSSGADITAGTATGSNQVIYWNNSASTPLLDVAVQAQGLLLNGKRLPNTLILGALVLPQLLNHPTIIARLNAGQTTGYARADLVALALAFGVERVLVAQGVYNSANENATATANFIFTPKSAWLGYVAPQPAIMTPSAGYRFAWAGIAGNTEGVRNWKYWDQPMRSWYVETAVNDAYQTVTTTQGVFFTGVVQ
jgi:hypothetical protein